MAGKGWNSHAGLLWIDEKAIWNEREDLFMASQYREGSNSSQMTFKVIKRIQNNENFYRGSTWTRPEYAMTTLFYASSNAVLLRIYKKTIWTERQHFFTGTAWREHSKDQVDFEIIKSVQNNEEFRKIRKTKAD